MACFLDLPPELLSVILQHLHVLAAACLVNYTFYTFAAPRLYQHIAIFPWHKRGKTKVVQLFTTLSRCQHLAKYVQILEIREFPKAFAITPHYLSNIVIKGLENCINLRRCVWTRDGSLSSSILQTLQKCTKLQELEINGHNDEKYDPSLLLQFTALSKLTLIMPSAPVISVLSPWVMATASTLRSLTLVCKASPLVTDAMLTSLAPNLVDLDHLHIAGCSKVTHEGIWAIILQNATGILGLSLEGLSPNFDMSEFAHRCSHSTTLSRLQSITLTVNQQTSLLAWMEDVPTLLFPAPLEKFQIYSTGAFFEASTTNDFWSRIVTRHGARLTKFAVNRMLISLEAIEDICHRCVALEELYVTVELDHIKFLGPCLSLAQKLRTVHINHPMDVWVTEDQRFFSTADAVNLVKKCGSNVTLFGCNTKVWQVNRTVNCQGDGQVTAIHLTPYEGTAIPEQFLVVRV